MAPQTDRFLLGIVAGAVLLVLAGVVAALLVGRAPTTPALDPSSPAGVVQAYLEALRAGEAERAYNYLSRAAQASTPRDRYLQQFPRASMPSESTRLLIEPATLGTDTATVKVTVSRFSTGGAPFSASTYHQEITVRLAREDGAWRIVQPTEPYPFIS